MRTYDVTIKVVALRVYTVDAEDKSGAEALAWDALIHSLPKDDAASCEVVEIEEVEE